MPIFTSVSNIQVFNTYIHTCTAEWTMKATASSSGAVRVIRIHWRFFWNCDQWQQSSIPLDRYQIEELIQRLDRERTGMVDYRYNASHHQHCIVLTRHTVTKSCSNKRPVKHCFPTTWGTSVGIALMCTFLSMCDLLSNICKTCDVEIWPGFIHRHKPS